MTCGKGVLMLCVVLVLVVLCTLDSTDGKKYPAAPARSARSTRSAGKKLHKRSAMDRGLAEYVTVFSTYLGEIPMTTDVKRLEKNLPTDKKMKLYNLKKSQRFARWNTGRGNKEVYDCQKKQVLIPAKVSYIHGSETVTVVDTKVMSEKGYIFTEFLPKGRYENQDTDAMEVIFAKPVHLRSLQFLGKHNLLKIALAWKDGSRWREIENSDDQLDWMVLHIESKVALYIPKTDIVRIYPQQQDGDKPIFFGMKFTGCF